MLSARRGSRSRRGTVQEAASATERSEVSVRENRSSTGHAAGPRLTRRRFLGLVGAGVSASSVGRSRGARADQGPSGADAPRSGGQLVVATWDEPISLDPANTAAAGLSPIRLMFDTLVVQGGDSTFVPGVAESWTISDGGRAYTFKLKGNITFHDGTPLDAHAVKFSLDRATSAQAKANFTISLAGVYQATEVRDDLTARIVLSQPYAAFLDALTEGYHAIVSPTAVAKYGRDFDQRPVGSGPYRLREWAAKSHVTLERNGSYAWGSSLFKHRGPPYPDQVTFRLVPEGSTRLAALETGEVHVAEEIPPEEVERLSKHPHVRMLSRVVPGTSAQLMINTTRPPLDDGRVRQALMYAINQEELCKVLFRGALTPARTALAPGTLGFDGSLAAAYRFDVDRARALLGDAGWKLGTAGLRVRNGQPLEASINIVSASIQALPLKVAELVQAQLREAGILLTIKQTDTAALFALLRQGGQQMVLGWRSGSDPDVMRPLFHSAFFGKSPVARILFKDERLDRLLVQGTQELNRARRQGIYREVQQIVLRHALVVPLWNRHALVGARPSLRDLTLDARGALSLYDAWLAEA
jgi:peptide/nickel transport system substrate-binding protein